MLRATINFPDELYRLVNSERFRDYDTSKSIPSFSRTVVALVNEGLKARAKREATPKGGERCEQG